MRTLAVPFFALATFIFISCRHYRDTNINVSESYRYYTMKAQFPKSKTRDVERYMDKTIGAGSTSFVNTRIDGQIALDDHTNFYIKKYSGFIMIKLNKSQNSYEAYQNVKSMCGGIKELLGK